MALQAHINEKMRAILIDWLVEQEIPVLVAVTKCDKLSANQRNKRLAEICRVFDMPADAVVPTSAAKGLGIAEIWGAVDAALGE